MNDLIDFMFCVFNKLLIDIVLLVFDTLIIGMNLRRGRCCVTVLYVSYSMPD